jgi:hypothetical protein
MKNRQLTLEELYALERKARHLRAAETARLLKAAARALRNLFSVRSVKGLRHA